MQWRYLFTIKRVCFQTVSKLEQTIFIVYIAIRPRQEPYNQTRVIDSFKYKSLFNLDILL